MTRPLDYVVGERLVIPEAVAPVRENPTHRSELVSQWILGETVTVEGLDGGWVRARGADGYSGWTPGAAFRHTAAAVDDWSATATLFSMGTWFTDTPEASDPTPGLQRLPWGARVAPAVGDPGDVLLPDGRTVTPISAQRLVGSPRSPDRSSETTGRVVRLAHEWSGVPYLWGGRTEFGVDCSGFVQSVFATCGVSLPRDSREQAEAGVQVPLAGPDAERRPGDLLFFAPGGGAVTHVGIFVGGTAIIHAASSNGAVRVDDLDAVDPLCELLRGSVVGHTRPVAG